MDTLSIEEIWDFHNAKYKNVDWNLLSTRKTESFGNEDEAISNTEEGFISDLEDWIEAGKPYDYWIFPHKGQVGRKNPKYIY